MGFYFINLLFVFLSVFMHGCFRWSIDSYLRLKKKSKTFIRKHSKGFMNYWFFEEINRECPLGFWYYLNKIHLFALIFVSFAIISMGYMDFMQIPITVLTFMLAVIQVPMGYFLVITQNKEWYGSAFVLFDIKPVDGRFPISFILIDLLMPFANFIFVYINIKAVTVGF